MKSTKNIRLFLTTIFNILLLAFFIFTPSYLFASDNNEKMPPLPTGLSKDTQFIIYYVDKKLEILQREMDKRFEILQREMDKRFEQVDKRFEILQREMDKRFEQVDKRFEQVDKRFEQMNKRFEEMFTFLWILAGIFTSLTAVVIGFAYWDRRTIIRQATNEAIERIEKEGKLQDFIMALRAFARKNSEFAEILKQFNLL